MFLSYGEKKTFFELRKKNLNKTLDGKKIMASKNKGDKKHFNIK